MILHNVGVVDAAAVFVCVDVHDTVIGVCYLLPAAPTAHFSIGRISPATRNMNNRTSKAGVIAHDWSKSDKDDWKYIELGREQLH